MQRIGAVTNGEKPAEAIDQEAQSRNGMKRSVSSSWQSGVERHQYQLSIRQYAVVLHFTPAAAFWTPGQTCLRLGGAWDLPNIFC